MGHSFSEFAATPPILSPATPPILSPLTPPILSPATPPILSPATPPILSPLTPPILSPAAPPTTYSSNAKLVCGTETLERCQDMYRSLKARLPQFVMEGVHNIWIVKPGALSRGRGIYCCTNLDEILDLVSSPTQKKEGKWIVQKYIGMESCDIKGTRLRIMAFLFAL